MIAVRRHVLELLKGKNAHIDFDSAISRIPVAHRGRKLPGSPHTLWQLLEHIRIAQWDILEFSRNPEHVSPKWPDGYWPSSEAAIESAAPPSEAAWRKSVAAVRAGLVAMQDLVANPKSDLLTPLAHGDGQTLLREALLVADHNAYHLGQLVLLRKMLEAIDAGA